MDDLLSEFGIVGASSGQKSGRAVERTVTRLPKRLLASVTSKQAAAAKSISEPAPATDVAPVPAAASDKSNSALKEAKNKKKKKQKKDADGEKAVVLPKAAEKPVTAEDRLAGSRFRLLNEELYTTSSAEFARLHKHDPSWFSVYHEGYRSQMRQWNVNPVDLIIKQIPALGNHLLIGDFGCGDAALAQHFESKCQSSVVSSSKRSLCGASAKKKSVLHGSKRVKMAQVLSFDLHSLYSQAVIGDISALPLCSNILDVSVFCLSLMGTNYAAMLKEAHRVTRPGGTLLIAEVYSRLYQGTNRADFESVLHFLGFKLAESSFVGDNNYYILYRYNKLTEDEHAALGAATLKQNAKNLQKYESFNFLKPCLYKRR